MFYKQKKNQMQTVQSTPKTVMVDVKKLTLNPQNPRVIKNKDFKQLVEDIKSFPEMIQLRPIIVNKDMMILAGEKRFKACNELKWKKVPVIIADKLSLAQQRKLILKDNTHAGTFDGIILGKDWDQKELQEWGLKDLVKMQLAPAEDGDIEFSQELDEESNYIVLRFTKDIDWTFILTELGLDSTYSKRQNNKAWSKGVGRVVDGMKAIRQIKKINI